MVSRALNMKLSRDVLYGIFNSERLPNEIISVFDDKGMSAHNIESVDGIKDALDNHEVIMAVEYITDNDNHNIVIVGESSDGNGYIAYDTDFDAGYYTIVTEDQLVVDKGYLIGVKK